MRRRLLALAGLAVLASVVPALAEEAARPAYPPVRRADGRVPALSTRQANWEPDEMSAGLSTAKDSGVQKIWHKRKA